MPNSPGGKSYEHYDPKYNIYEEPQIIEEDTEAPTRKVNYAKSKSSTILIIGIVVVVIIAIILIIIIVYKMRSKSEVNYKMDESKAALHLETEERPSISNGFSSQQKPLIKTGATASNSNNNNSSGSNSKPVKEWYV